jgi:hypothetical protein
LQVVVRQCESKIQVAIITSSLQQAIEGRKKYRFKEVSDLSMSDQYLHKAARILSGFDCVATIISKRHGNTESKPELAQRMTLRSELWRTSTGEPGCANRGHLFVRGLSSFRPASTLWQGQSRMMLSYGYFPLTFPYMYHSPKRGPPLTMPMDHLMVCTSL